ncbi:Ldh family oxidoreductase [Microlunatus speluncae]|uniref:Ldh family oxidoreductase n=1 Tax=Microlunatus speluncae TaxID=2594267 RepID=UPI0012663F1B|nr:Ldh family oxidoreductase [Microlunatus speluncae]
MRVPLATARALATEVLVGAGVSARHAAQQAAVLVDAEARQVPSHGLLRLPRLVRRIAGGVADPRTCGSHTWLSPTYLRVDGEQGLGPPVALHALDAVITAAEQSGVATAAITRNNHLGMLGYYARVVAGRGLACLAMTTSEPLVHPWGGSRAMIGTNPLAIAVPAEPQPLVLDMATSMISMGRVHDHARRGRPLDPGWALDAEGRPTTDAAAAMDGSLAPFGGAKGYALGLALGAIVSFVTGSVPDVDVRGTLDDEFPSGKGDLFIVLKGAQRPIADFLDQIRATPPINGDRPVTVPGDGGERRARAAQDSGIDLDDGLWSELLALRAATDPVARANRGQASQESEESCRL